MGIKKEIETLRGTGNYSKLERIWIEKSPINGDPMVVANLGIYSLKENKKSLEQINPKFDQYKLKKAIDEFKKACYESIIDERLTGGIQE